MTHPSSQINDQQVNDHKHQHTKRSKFITPPCAALARKNDPDRYFLSLFAPAPARPAIWALIAFNAEIAKTREVVTETQLGHIRLQWWREELHKIYTNAAHQPHDILDALSIAIRAHGLPQDVFENLLYAREFDLEDTAPAHMEGVLKYADFTSTPLLTLMAMAAGADTAREPLYPLATAYALCGILRAVPFHAAMQRSVLPEDLMTRHGVSLNALYRGKPERGVCDVTKAMHAHIIMDAAPEHRFLKATQCLTKLYARKFVSARFDPFDARLARPLAFKELRVAIAALF